MTLLWPVSLQWQRNRKREFVDGGVPPADDPAFMDRWVEHLTKNDEWQQVQDADAAGYPPLQGNHSAAAYAEFCYFHPFVRNFLYVNRDDMRQHLRRMSSDKRPTDNDQLTRTCGKAVNRNLRIVQRPNAGRLSVDYEMALDGREYGFARTFFKLSPCWLYLFDTQIAILSIRLEHDRSFDLEGQRKLTARNLNLRMVMKLQNICRRAYAPYFSVFPTDTHLTHKGGHCPHRVQLWLKDPAAGNESIDLTTISPPDVVSEYGRFEQSGIEPEDLSRYQDEWYAGEFPADAGKDAFEHRNHVFFHREPYTARWLQRLMSPLHPTQLSFDPDEPESMLCPTSAGSCLRFEQIEDDRIPVLSYVQVPEPRSITDPDWLRLAAIDDDGDSQLYPYSPEFLGPDPLREYAYDRFWHSTGRAPAQAFHNTRWLCSGYGFVGVGATASEFFGCADSGALAHYRHHYFAIAMIAHFHRASLLRLKHSLSEAADALLNPSDPSGEKAEERDKRYREFREETENLMRSLLRFRTLYWFPEVSNQLQGHELFENFRQHLKLQSLFDDVCADLQQSADLLKKWDEERISNQQDQLQTAVVMLGLILGVAGPVLLHLAEGLKHEPFWFAWPIGMVFLGMTLLVTPIRMRIAKIFPACDHVIRVIPDRGGVRKHFGKMIAGALLVAGIAWVFWGLMGSPAAVQTRGEGRAPATGLSVIESPGASVHFHLPGIPDGDEVGQAVDTFNDGRQAEPLTQDASPSGEGGGSDDSGTDVAIPKEDPSSADAKARTREDTNR